MIFSNLLLLTSDLQSFQFGMTLTIWFLTRVLQVEDVQLFRSRAVWSTNSPIALHLLLHRDEAPVSLRIEELHVISPESDFHELNDIQNYVVNITELEILVTHPRDLFPSQLSFTTFWWRLVFESPHVGISLNHWLSSNPMSRWLQSRSL